MTVRKWAAEWSYSAPANPNGVEIVAEVNTGGYDWSVAAILRRPHGDDYEWSYYVDSGCSCNSPYEDAPEDKRYDLSWFPGWNNALGGLVAYSRDPKKWWPSDMPSDWRIQLKTQVKAVLKDEAAGPGLDVAG